MLYFQCQLGLLQDPQGLINNTRYFLFFFFFKTNNKNILDNCQENVLFTTHNQLTKDLLSFCHIFPPVHTLYVTLALHLFILCTVHSWSRVLCWSHLVRSLCAVCVRNRAATVGAPGRRCWRMQSRSRGWCKSSDWPAASVG